MWAVTVQKILSLKCLIAGTLGYLQLIILIKTTVGKIESILLI